MYSDLPKFVQVEIKHNLIRGNFKMAKQIYDEAHVKLSPNQKYRTTNQPYFENDELLSN